MRFISTYSNPVQRKNNTKSHIFINDNIMDIFSTVNDTFKKHLSDNSILQLLVIF